MASSHDAPDPSLPGNDEPLRDPPVNDCHVQVQPLRPFRTCEGCPEMVVLPDRRLALGRYEVTVGEYRAFASATGGSAGGRRLAFGEGDSWENPALFADGSQGGARRGRGRYGAGPARGVPRTLRSGRFGPFVPRLSCAPGVRRVTERARRRGRVRV